MNCLKCGRPLSCDEAALHCKLVNRGATEFMCIMCLSEYFKIPVEKLRELIVRFREAGCSLFR